MTSNRLVTNFLGFAWILLFAFWVLHFVLSLRDFFPALQDVCLCTPDGMTPIQTATGMTWAQLASSNPRFSSFLGATLIDDGISGVGLAVFGMFVSATSYRKGEKWAWYAQWSMPLGILAAQLNVYQLTGSVMVVVLAGIFTVVSLFALFLPFRQFFPKEQTSRSP